jgi:hypothetical protein
MNTASWIAFRDLLEKGGPNKKMALLRYISDEEREKLSEVPLPSRDPFSYAISMQERVCAIHYSWLITFLEPFSEKDKIKILSALEPTQAEKLKNHFKIEDPLETLSPHTERFLLRSIYEWLVSEQKEFIPLEFLPSHPLNPILDLSKSSIQHLVDFLGLHDLSLELKKVVKTDQIKKIQKALSKVQRDYLKNLLKGKEPVSFARLNLDGWDGNEEQLKKILHHRGFNRLSKALFGCHPSLMWHITHRLDTGRTKILRKFFTDINNDQAQEALTNQIVDLIPLIRQHYE